MFLFFADDKGCAKKDELATIEKLKRDKLVCLQVIEVNVTDSNATEQAINRTIAISTKALAILYGSTCAIQSFESTFHKSTVYQSMSNIFLNFYVQHQSGDQSCFILPEEENIFSLLHWIGLHKALMIHRIDLVANDKNAAAIVKESSPNSDFSDNDQQNDRF